MEIILVAIGIFGLVGGFSLLFFSPRAITPEEVVQRRVEAIASGNRNGGQLPLIDAAGEETIWERTATFFLGKQDLPEQYGSTYRLLHQAGHSGLRALRIFWGTRIFLAIALGAGMFFLTALSAAPVPKVMVYIGGGSTCWIYVAAPEYAAESTKSCTGYS